MAIYEDIKKHSNARRIQLKNLFIGLALLTSTLSFTAQANCKLTPERTRNIIVAKKTFEGSHGLAMFYSGNYQAALAKAQEKCFSSGYSGCEESSRWGKPSIDTTIKYVQVLGYKYNKEQLSENEIADNRCMLIDQCISKVVSGKSDMSLEKLAQVKDIYNCY